MVFVPYPFAAEDHQTVNAMNLVHRKAALMVKDSEAMERLVPAVLDLATDEQQQNELTRNIALTAVQDADERIAGEILKSIGKE